MNVRLSDFFKMYQLSTGRRIFALRRIREHAVRLGATALVERIDEALAHDEKTRRLDLAWSGARLQRASGGRRVFEVDNRMDRSLTGLRDGIRALAAGAPPDDPIHGQVHQLLDALFPAGVQAVTSLPMIDQLAAVEVIVELLQGELAPLVAEVGITTNVRRVIELADEYRAVLEERQSQVTFAEVQAARDEGHALFCSVIGLVFGTFYRADQADHMDAQAGLLAPVLEQNEAVRVYRRNRRPVVDIDPDTGELTDRAPVDSEDSASDDGVGDGPGDAAAAGEPDASEPAAASDDASAPATAS